jgi:phosphoribosylamine--glycine ligase
MRERGTPFAGLLYVGLALTSAGLKVVEFNARFGDPETQAVLALLDSPLIDLLHRAATGRLGDAPALRWHDGAVVTVVLAAEGYPGAPRFGDPVEGVDAVTGATVLHAGTAYDDEERLVSSGGRVLSVTAVGADVAAARAAAYDGMGRIRLRGGHYRRDIAADR